jgi:hypothetical protein
MATNQQLNAFLTDIALDQRDRVKRLSAFLTKAEKLLLDNINLDNIALSDYNTLTKTVSELQNVIINAVDMMRKIASNNAPEGGSLEADAIAYELSSTWTPEELVKLKEAMRKIKAPLKMVKK